MKKVLIIEDELIIAVDIKDILQARGYEVIGTSKSYAEAVKSLAAELPDICLIDIKIKGDKDGIELAKYISSNYSIPFIFITSHADPRTLESVKSVRPYGYLLKPFEDDEVLVAIEMAISNFEKDHEKEEDIHHSLFEGVLDDCLFVRQKNLAIKLPFNDIIYIKAESNYCQVVSEKGGYTIRATLKEISQKLPDSSFFRSHKSYLINLKRVSAINSIEVHLDKHRLPIGREQQAQLMSSINKA